MWLTRCRRQIESLCGAHQVRYGRAQTGCDPLKIPQGYILPTALDLAVVGRVQSDAIGELFLGHAQSLAAAADYKAKANFQRGIGGHAGIV